MSKLANLFDKNPVIYSEAYAGYLSSILLNLDHAAVARFIKLILDARESGNKIFFIGNGGSASTCSHFANDLQIGTASFHKPIRAISLTDNVSILTAIANDYGYEDLFTRQLKMLGQEGDIVVAISASGNSPNLLNAVNYCRENRLSSFSLVAFDGGKLKLISDDHIHIKTGFKEYGPAEDMHMILDHLVMTYISMFIRSEA